MSQAHVEQPVGQERQNGPERFARDRWSIGCDVEGVRLGSEGRLRLVNGVVEQDGLHARARGRLELTFGNDEQGVG
jgi:hypothetical protein